MATTPSSYSGVWSASPTAVKQKLIPDREKAGRQAVDGPSKARGTASAPAECTDSRSASKPTSVLAGWPPRETCTRSLPSMCTDPSTELNPLKGGVTERFL